MAPVTFTECVDEVVRLRQLLEAFRTVLQDRECEVCRIYFDEPATSPPCPACEPLRVLLAKAEVP